MHLRAVVAAVVAAATVAGGPVATAHASEAAAPANDAPAYPTPNVDMSGHGWGHARGMGQWGAYGYAVDYHQTSAQILDHFYGPSTAAIAPSSTMTVRLMAQDSIDLVVTSASPWHIGPMAVNPGSAGRITRLPDGRWHLYTSYGCGMPEVWETDITDVAITSDIADPGDDLNKMLVVCRAGHRYTYRGSLTQVYADGAVHTVNSLPIDQYVRGVVPNESPSYWGDTGGGAALEAQAVAARSYSLAEFRYSYAKTCDSTSCQVYSGAAYDATRKETPQTDFATFSTANVIRKMPDGSVARTEFSASTGGYTVPGTFTAVPDLGDTRSPYHDWSASVSVASVQSKYPTVGTITSIAVTGRNGLGDGGGRVVTIQIVGTAGSVTTSGSDFQLKLGLRSNWFFVAGDPSMESWYLTNAWTSPTAEITFGYGAHGDIPISCDWNGDGISTPGTFNGGLWNLRNSNSTGSPDIILGFGDIGDVPVCGDWNGDGVDTIGVFRAGHFFERDTNSTGPATRDFYFGNGTDVPVAGDWTNSGRDTIGVFRDGWFFLRLTNAGGPADRTFMYGNVGDRPIAGDWNGDGADTIGIKRGGAYYVRNSNTSGVADASYAYGNDTDVGVVGDWNDDARDTIAAVRNV